MMCGNLYLVPSSCHVMTMCNDHTYMITIWCWQTFSLQMPIASSAFGLSPKIIYVYLNSHLLVSLPKARIQCGGCCSQLFPSVKKKYSNLNNFKMSICLLSTGTYQLWHILKCFMGDGSCIKNNDKYMIKGTKW